MTPSPPLAPTDMAAVKSYYETIGATVLLDTTYSDGVQVLELVIVDDANIHLQFWDHTDATGRRLQADDNSTTVETANSTTLEMPEAAEAAEAAVNATVEGAYWEVVDFEAYLNTVHADTLLT